MKDRKRMIQLLAEEYDKWEREEQKNIDNGSGMRGSNSDLSGFSFDDLFNEVVWRLSSNIMKQNEKDGLLQDIFARLPYGVKFALKPVNPDYDLPYSGEYKVETVYIRDGGEYNFCFENHGYVLDVKHIKPYLRSMSNMTEEEQKEWIHLRTEVDKYTVGYDAVVDFYNSHHLDYRGLIYDGLALEAPADMY